MRPVNRALQRMALPRLRGGGWQRVANALAQVGEKSKAADLLTHEALLTRLEKVDGRAFEVLQLSCFGGLSREESVRTIRDRWRDKR